MYNTQMSYATEGDRRWSEIYLTFSASIRSVGTACTLAAVGVYLHRRGFVIGDGKRTLALISQQVTIPLLFFTKIVFCNQDWSNDPCPNITDSLKDVWVLMLWPIYVVAVGFSVGFGVAKLSKTPPHQLRGVLVACAFGNSTGLPITLLTVVHSNFPVSSDLGRIDPCLFLSVYLLMYPVLQWGIGGWLLAPEPRHGNKTKGIPERSNGDDDGEIEQALLPTHHRRYSGLAHNVLNRTQKMGNVYQWTHRGMAEIDASLYMSVHDNLNTYGPPPNHSSQIVSKSLGEDDQQPQPMAKDESFQSIGMDLSREDSVLTAMDAMIIQEGSRDNEDLPVHAMDSPLERSQLTNEQTFLLQPIQSDDQTFTEEVSSEEESFDSDNTLEENCWDTMVKIVARCLQPPVVGALLGMFVASFPKLRGVFVDMIDRDDTAPLEWLFDALYNVGQAAVPINMMILGCNLSASYMNSKTTNPEEEMDQKKKLFSPETTISIVVGKMFIMPIVGFLSALLFKTYFWDIPDGR